MVQFMNLVAPGQGVNASLDFSPLMQAFQAYQRGSDAAQRQSNMTAIGKTAAAQGYGAAGKQALSLGELDTGAALQDRGVAMDDKRIKKIGSMAQATFYEQDPIRRAQKWQRTLRTLGDTASLSPEELDPMTGPELMMAEAGIVRDPREEKMKDLELQHKQAQINAANRREDVNTPANIREWQVFQAMTPDQQKQYLSMKRAEQWKDVGTGYVNPADQSRVIPKDLVGQERQKGLGQDLAKTQAELPEAKFRSQMVTDNLNRLKDSANSVMNQPGLGKIVGGLYQAYVPNASKDALNAQTELENLKVKISGVVLQSMRDMSKTGGAVGQVTEREWPRLENMIANLDPRQGREQFEANLRQVIAYADQVTAQIQAAYEADLAKVQGGTAPPGAVAAPQSQDWQDLGNGIKIRAKP